MRLNVRRIASKFRPARSARLPLAQGAAYHPSRSKARSFMMRRTPAKVYGQIGTLEVRLARSRGDVRRAQRLRYRVFYEEMSAIPDATTMLNRRDEDPYDAICDHLLVVDRGAVPKTRQRWPRRARAVGTYRVLRQDIAERHGGFYTQSEYDIAPLIARKRETHKFMELGRSCVLKPYRNRRTVELLWQGIWTYVREHGVDVMLGCASFAGTDPNEHKMALSFLHHFASAPDEWQVRAHDHLYRDMNLLPAEEVDQRAALKALPPLIKGYLRLGAYVGDGAVVDQQFGTTDVLIILPVEAIDSRYFDHFGAPNQSAASVAMRPRSEMI
ncbi:GNAT family N-acyltransferase [Dichotomicrobium thermohalophilum]|uniref:GNAT family N-acetyltransferase n=1 Tax=Dichotomicrobium thermohalophilum TaxID=933063 RepID=UPI000E5AC5FE